MEWLKLKCDLLQNEKIRLIRAEKGGDAVSFLWVGLLCLAGSQENDGVFQIHGQPLTIPMLARLLGVPPYVMRRALELFLLYGMVAQENGTFYLPGWEEHQSVDALELRRSRDRARQKLYRERQKALARGESVTLASQKNPLADKDKDKEKDKEKEKDSLPLNPPPGDERASFSGIRSYAPPEGVESAAFLSFWNAYPKREGRASAQKEWLRLSPSPELTQTILSDLTKKRESLEWTRENGRYVPRPARYLTERRWEDEPGAGEAAEGRAYGQKGEKSYDLDEAFRKAEERQRRGL